MLCLQDHPEYVQKVTKLLVKLVKHNPDLSEESWQYRTASLVPAMMMISSGSDFVTITNVLNVSSAILYRHVYVNKNSNA